MFTKCSGHMTPLARIGDLKNVSKGHITAQIPRMRNKQWLVKVEIFQLLTTNLF